MKNKTNYKSRRKKLYSCLIAGVAICSLTACDVQAITENQNDKEMVVLENQQQDINNVLAIKKIEKVEGFRAIRWLDNTRIIGVLEQNKIQNVSIYNLDDGTLKTISKNNKTTDEVTLGAVTNIKDGFVIYQVYKQNTGYDSRTSVYAINLEKLSENKIDDNIETSAVSKIENNEVIYAKEMKVYRYNLLNGEKSEIVLPQKLQNELNVFCGNFEEYLKLYDVTEKDRQDEYYMENMKGWYDYEKNNNHIFTLRTKGDEIFLKTYMLKPFIYNVKTNTYKEYKKSNENIKAKGNKQEIVELEWGDALGEDKIWKLDSQGNRIELIEEGNIVGSIYISPDNSKVVYRMNQTNGEDNMYVYDIRSGKKVVIFEKANSAAFWNENSNKLLFLSIDTEDNNKSYTTNIVTLN